MNLYRNKNPDKMESSRRLETFITPEFCCVSQNIFVQVIQTVITINLSFHFLLWIPSKLNTQFLSINPCDKQSRFFFSLLHSSICIFVPAELPAPWCWALQAARLSASNLLVWLGVLCTRGNALPRLYWRAELSGSAWAWGADVDNLRSNCLARNASVQGTENLFPLQLLLWECILTVRLLCYAAQEAETLLIWKVEGCSKHVEDVDQSWADVVSEKSPLWSCHFRISFCSGCWLKLLYPTDITGAQWKRPETVSSQTYY